ncbi:MAG TPA: hypothetical protein VGE45_09115 [Chloroflexia bacterium]|jgi:hypothetical protein
MLMTYTAVFVRAQTPSHRFPETGQTLQGKFLDYWNQNGGLPQQGFPITPEFYEESDVDGKIYLVQYFERAVFEYHPDAKPEYHIQLSLLGSQFYKKNYPSGAPGEQPNIDPGSIYFPQTGKRLGGKFLDYWSRNGGVQQQGYPISDEFREVSALNGETYTVQYFERAVFEIHPDYAGGTYEVLLSHLGRYRFQAGKPTTTITSSITPSNTVTSKLTATPTATATHTATPTRTAAITPTATNTATPSNTVTSTPTTPPATPAFTPTATGTPHTPTPTATHTVITSTPTASPSATPEPPSITPSYTPDGSPTTLPPTTPPTSTTIEPTVATDTPIGEVTHTAVSITSTATPTTEGNEEDPTTVNTDLWIGLGLITSIVLLAAVVFMVKAWKVGTGVSFGVVLRETIVVVPIFGSLTTVLLATAQWNLPGWQVNHTAWVIGLLTALIVWILAAWLYTSVGTANHAGSHNYTELRDRLVQLCWTYEKYCLPPNNVKADSCERIKHYIGRIIRQIIPSSEQLPNSDDKFLNQINKITDRQLRLVQAYDYIMLWKWLHHAEESLMMVIPEDELSKAVRHDWNRINGSKIRNSSELLDTLGPMLPKSKQGVGSASPIPKPDDSARLDVQRVREEVNRFRDSRRDYLAQARGNLAQLARLVWLLVYVLAILGTLTLTRAGAVATIGSDGVTNLRSVAAYFLVGATVGLLTRLYAALTSDVTLEDDYGLTQARLLNAPLMSGLAAVGGVLVFALLNPVLVPNQPDGTASTKLPGLLSGFFDVGTYPFGLLVAAIFGFAPNLLIKALQRQIEQYQEDLKSTNASKNVPDERGASS